MATEPKPWTVLDRRYVLDRQPYMTLREDTVELPNGARINDYFVFEYPDWAITLAVTRDEHFVLIRQYRHGIGKVIYELPAGVVDPSEPLLESARRELLEETGYGGGQWQAWMQVSANPATHTNTAHVFLATGVELVDEQRLDHTEDIEVQILGKSETLALLRAGAFVQAMQSAPLWRYFAEFGM